MGESYLNFFFGLSEGIRGSGSEMGIIFHRGTLWFCGAWFIIYCTLVAWIKTRFIGWRFTFTVNALFSLLFVNPWTLGNMAFYGALVLPSPFFLLWWVLYFWILPMLFDLLMFRGLPGWSPFVRLSQKWPNPRAFIVSTLSVFIAFIPAFVAFTLGLTDALIIPK